jgi:hypothetical protein
MTVRIENHRLIEGYLAIKAFSLLKALSKVTQCGE